MNLEQQLREALKPRDPGEDFAANVLARLPAAAPVAAPARNPRRVLWPFALAASVLLAFVATQLFLEQRRQERALTARAQLEQALEITGAELNMIQQRLNPEN